MKRLSRMRFMSAGCAVLATIILVFDVVNYKQGLHADHGFFIVTLLILSSALELVRSELAELRQRVSEEK